MLSVTALRRLVGNSVSLRDRDAWPEKMIQKMPRKPPIVLLGRLACDHRARGQGLDGLLLFDAIQRIVRVSE